ncbi:acetolactate synthase small subunit [Luteibacter yeojuensis]
MRHLVSLLLQNEAGALARVAGLFASRGYNIESLTVAATHDMDASRLTLVVFGDDTVVEQIVKQSAKLVDVIEVSQLSGDGYVERELLVAHVEARDAAAIDTCLTRFGARLLHGGDGRFVVEYTGRAEDVDTFLDALRQAGRIADHARSGIAAIEWPLVAA